MVLVAYLNSLVETEEQVVFFQYSLGNVNQAALMLLAEISKIQEADFIAHQNAVYLQPYSASARSTSCSSTWRSASSASWTRRTTS